MKKKIISLLLSLAMVASIIPTALADEVVKDDTKAAEENQLEISENDMDDVIPESSQEDTDTPAEDIEETPEPQETELPPAEEESESIPDEPTAEPQEVDVEEIDASIELMATGTYYPEYKFYFDSSSGTITDADEDISGTLNIPEKINGSEVKQIGYRAFRNCKSLTSVNIPKTVTRIDTYAFQDCVNLSDVTLNYNNAREFKCEINYGAFSGCTNLRELIIPESVTKLGSHIIEKTSIQSITIPKSVTSSDRGVLSNCPSLTQVILEDGMTVIPYGLCEGCSNITSINIPKTVTQIDTYAFLDCINLSDVTLNYNNAREFECEIGYGAFSGCTSLRELIIPESVTKLGSNIIEKTAIETITIPKSVKSSDSGTLANCPSLTTVILEEGMTVIPYGLCNCNGYSNSYISNVVIPDSITEIDTNAFMNCDALTSVNIPKTVKLIGWGAFENCDNLTNVTLNYNNSREFECTISSYAFSKCTNLKELIIPESVTKLGSNIIEKTAIETITIPKSIKSSDSGVLANCPSLTHVILEDGMTVVPYGLCNYGGYNNSYIENVTIPDSVTEIGAEAFYNCDAITEVNIPKSVSKIGYEAFENCNSLSKVTFNYNDTEDFKLEIGWEAFADCPNIKEMSLPEKVSSLGSQFIRGTAISSITVPSTVTSASSAFDNTIWLDNVYFANGIKKIPNEICANYNNNSYITKVEIPMTVTEIGYEAFENCIRLPQITIPEGVTKIEWEAFNNCPNLTVYCAESTPAITELIDNNINFSITKNISSYENLVYSNTHFVTDYSDVSTAGMVNLEVQYKFKDDVIERIKNPSVIIRLPEAVEVLNSTVKVNGVVSTDFENDNNILTIPVTEMSGTVSLCAEPTEQTRILSYALMSYNLDNNWTKTKDVIGVINQDIPILTVKADNVTASDKITVSGVAVPEETIDFYYGNEKLGDATALISGKYQAEITLPSTENYKTYTIEAVSGDYSGAEITAKTDVTYQEGAPELTSFDMYYNGVKYDLFAAREIKPTITFASNIPFSFRVKFDNVENLEQVYIVSNRNNSIKKMQAEYDAASGAYIATGYFDDSNHSYVPGVISVEYLQKGEPFLFSKEIDFSSARYVNTMPEAWEGNTITLTNDEGEPEAEIQLTAVSDDALQGVIKFVNTIRGDLDFNIFSEVIPSYITRENASEYGYERVVDDAGEELYVKLAEEADSKIQSEVLSFIQGKASKFFIENKAYGADMTLDSLNSVSSVLGDIDKIVTFNNNRVDINNAKQEVLNSSWSPEVKQEKLHRLDIAKKSNNANLAIMMVSTALAMSGIGVPAACSLILAGLSYQNTADIEYALGDWTGLASRQSAGTNLTFRWKIDPSGYVYEAVTSNRLEGVTATAYWKEDENSTSTVWNAAEYEQANPLITDVNGLYSWDVPEGLWQVKYEKEGYVTQTSDWLPVPPPQTDVNIGMVSKAAPKVESAALTSNALTITFDKYMKPETVADVTISGHTYTMDYSKNETAPDGTIYAKTYTFRLNEPVSEGESVTASIKNAESYADVKMTAYNETVTCSNNTTVEYTVNIENVSEDKANKSISADIVSASDKMQSFDTICAIYDANGRLISMKTSPVVGLETEETINKVFRFDADWATYKVFVWDSVNGMKPLAINKI